MRCICNNRYINISTPIAGSTTPIDLSGYVTFSDLLTASGILEEEIGDFITINELTTVSGDIINQFDTIINEYFDMDGGFF